jgi:hypothetical protein
MSNKDSNATKLFKYKFPVEVREIYLMDEVLMDEYGTPTTGNDQLDAMYVSQTSTVMLTPAQLYEVYGKGGGWRFIKPRDSVTVYEIICGHIDDWKNNSNRINGKKAPMEDLRGLDRMAAAIYNTARMYMKEDAPKRTADAILGISNPMANPNIKQETSVDEKHQSLTDMLNVPGVRSSRSNPWK